MKKRMASLLFFLSLTGPVLSTTMGDLAAQMKPGDWRELVTTGLSQSFLETSGNNPANHSILQYAAKGMWDPATEQFFFLGSPHDNPYKFIVYSAANNSWRTGPIPNACMNAGMYSGGCALHSYYYAAGIENGKFYTYTGAAGGKLYGYDIAGNSWSAVSGNPIPMYGPTYGGSVYSPERQGFIYACGNVGVWFCSKSTGIWSEVPLPSGMSWGYYQAFVQYNPVHHEILFGGGEGGKREVYKVSNSGALAVTHLSTSPIGIGVGNGNVAIDPVSGHYIVCTGAQMSEFNSQTNQWKSLSTLPPQEIQGDFTYEIAAASVSNYGVIMYLTYSPAKVYLYKHSAGTGSEAKVEAKAEGGLLISPNPVRSAARIEMKGAAGWADVKVYDLAGREILRERGFSSGTALNIAPLANGVYVLEARQGMERLRKTFLVQK